jgi:DNA-directed RNA polymerase I and III subunit RPAC2
MASVYEKTFMLKDEDHTMGNTLRYMLNKNPQVSLAGYSVPHPMETSVNVRVQTTGEVTATAAMRDALLDIISVCDHVHDTFGDAVDEFKAKNPTSMDTGTGKK